MNAKKWTLTILLIVTISVLSVWYLGINGLLVAVPSDLLILVLTNLEMVGSLLASSYKIGRGISFWFEKNAVEKRLESTIGSCSKKVNAECEELLPHGVDVTWVPPMERDALLKEGKVIVYLESSHNESRNLARATMLYVDEDLIRESQQFVNPTIMKSAKFAIAKKMLMMDRKPDALRYLNQEFIEPEVGKTPEIGEYVTATEIMDTQGHLTRILLHELSLLGPKLSPRLSDLQAIKETKTFTDFLRVFEEREREEDVPLDHAGKIIRVHILPVARTGTTFDTYPFVYRANQDFNDKIDTLYVLARGALNLTLAELVVEEIEKKRIYKKQKSWKFRIPGESGLKRKTVESYVAVLSRMGTESEVV